MNLVLTSIHHLVIVVKQMMKIANFESSISFSESSGDTDTDSGEEIWEASGSEAEYEKVERQSVKDVLFGLSVFLTFFQLAFRITERAMSALLAFLKTMLLHFSQICATDTFLHSVAQSIPKTCHGIRKTLSFESGTVTEYVVCPKCHSLYLPSQCDSTRKCDFIEYPEHVHVSRQTKCGAVLMKSVRISGKQKLVPRKNFYYHSIISALEQFVKRKDFLKLCEHWRHPPFVVPQDTYSDIYDGRVWKDRQHLQGRPFLALPGNLCLMLNIDWFSPFEHTPSIQLVQFILSFKIYHDLRDLKLRTLFLWA